MFEEGIIGATADFSGLYRDNHLHYRSRGRCNPSKCTGKGCKDVCPCKEHEFNFATEDRIMGTRTIEDIDLSILDDNVTFVLHGCNTANTDPCWLINSTEKNFARALFEKLATKLANPTIFGHFQSVCAGQDTAWVEYSKRFPIGERNRRKIGPLPYDDIGNSCCRKRRK